MLRISLFILIGLLAACSKSSSTESSPKPPSVSEQKPLKGMLQFQLRHNLENDDCLSDSSCFLNLEASADDIDNWLSEIRNHSDMAVLHWDRSIPWHIFNQDAPPNENTTDFYDAQIKPDLLRWVNAFARQFELMERGFLAVSILHGERNRLEKMAIDTSTDNDIELTESCPAIQPGLTVNVQYQDNNVAQQVNIDIEKAYLNFVMYLYHKLDPDYFAIMVESNLYKELCPQQWSGLVALYHDLYDQIKNQVDPQTYVFSTLTLQHLLKYELDTCYSQLSVSACGDDSVFQPYETGNPDSCYPMDASPVWDLNQGDRLDILALSFYPDSLTFAPNAEDRTLTIYDNSWNGVDREDCTTKILSPPYVDPLSRLDDLNWQKPIAFAETSARSCRTYIWKTEGNDELIIRPATDQNTQAFWLDTLLSRAKDDKFEFFVQSFMQDYDPLGLWVVRNNILPASIYSLFNLWSCSGLVDKEGNEKSAVMDIWSIN